MSRFKDKFAFAVSHTTRKPRRGEINGVHYHYVSHEAMQLGIDNKLFVEHAQVHSNIYGTSHEAISRIHSTGRICIMDIDVSGVKQLREASFSAKFVFIAPPSIDVLEQRLRERGTESEEQLKVRLGNAKEEIEYGLCEGNFDAVVYNDCRQAASEKLFKHVSEWFPAVCS
mmetsp:Transcript_8656/g.12927  ORF Transcript_8656/g.12927 Transcript_8656/m.12927 type:complete len:171 (-) Transcript_8656:182-694(-)